MKLITHTVEMKCIAREPGGFRMELVAIDGHARGEPLTLFLPMREKKMKRAYVGNVPFTTTEDELREWFKPYEITEIQIVHDRNTGRPRGFAFVEFASENQFELALRSHNERELDGRRIVVNDAVDKRGRR